MSPSIGRIVSTLKISRFLNEKSAVDIYIKDFENVAYIGDYEVGLFSIMSALDKGANLIRQRALSIIE